MSTTSAVTALVARDHIISNIADLSNHMCIFVLTRGDGTPFDTSSIQEEDVIEICIWLGHAHPEGVLWYSAIESVILFHTTDELQVMVCGVVKASPLCKEAIRVRSSPPSATHVRAYMAAVNGEPSGAPPLPSEGRRNPILPLATPTWVGRPHNKCKQILGILQMMSCDSSWRISAGGHSLITECTPRDSHQEILWEMGILMQMTGRSPFQEGEGGFPNSSHFDLLPLHNQMEGGNPEDNLLAPQHLFNPMRICGT